MKLFPRTDSRHGPPITANAVFLICFPVHKFVQVFVLEFQHKFVIVLFDLTLCVPAQIPSMGFIKLKFRITLFLFIKSVNLYLWMVIKFQNVFRDALHGPHKIKISNKIVSMPYKIKISDEIVFIYQKVWIYILRMVIKFQNVFLQIPSMSLIKLKFLIKLFPFIKSVNLYFENGNKCFHRFPPWACKHSAWTRISTWRKM